MGDKKKVVIVGSGIAGLSTAFYLHRDYDVSVFEKGLKPGGHTDTHDLVIDGAPQRIDSGFIVFCREYYPNFCAMLDRLGVESKPTNMSFSAYNRKSGVIYNATSINKLFCQRRNLFSPKFYRMLFDLVRFYRTAPALLQKDDFKTSVATYLEQHNYSDAFSEDHLLPMISALWSATPQRVRQFPVRHLVEFMHCHGMMKLLRRPAWRVVVGGSDSYVIALQKQLDCTWHIGSKVLNVMRDADAVTVQTADGNCLRFDAVVLATHADQALAILDQPSDSEQQILGNIQFEKNHVVVHTDESIMHPNRAAWASWNTVVPDQMDSNSLQCCTANYWMNSLQGLDMKSNVFTTLNSHDRIDPSRVLAERSYDHPIFNAESIDSQRQLQKINGSNNTYYVGAYWGWGFHEDGARSARTASELIRQQLR